MLLQLGCFFVKHAMPWVSMYPLEQVGLMGAHHVTSFSCQQGSGKDAGKIINFRNLLAA